MAIEFGTVLAGPNLILRPDVANGGVIIGEGPLGAAFIKTNPGFAGTGYAVDTFASRSVDATVAARGFSRVCAPSAGIIVTARIIAKRDGATADVSAYVLTAAGSRNGTGNITLIGSALQTVVGETTASMDCVLAVDTTTQRFNVNCTGVAAQNYNWSIQVETQQIDGTLTA